MLLLIHYVPVLAASYRQHQVEVPNYRSPTMEWCAQKKLHVHPRMEIESLFHDLK